MHLFTEIFPFDAALAEYVGAYTLTSDLPAPELDRVGRTLARRLRESYPAEWVWAGGRLLTDTVRSEIELVIALDILRGAEPERFGGVSAITQDAEPDARLCAELIMRTKAEPLRGRLNATLRDFNTTIPAGETTLSIERDVRLAAWAVDHAPALSITVSSRLVYGRDAAATLAILGIDAMTGLRVHLPDTSFSAEITGAGGVLRDERTKLLKRKLPAALLALIQNAPDASSVLRLKNQNGTLQLPAAGLQLLVRPADFARLEIDPARAEPALRPDPPTRATIIRTLSDILKDAGIIGRAYSSREQPDRFFIPTEDDMPYLRYAEKRTRPAIPGKLPTDFMACGAYRLRERFETAPIRVCVVNALNTKIEDFVEALQRQLARKMNFRIDVARERQVRVVSEANLDAAVKIVEKEAPDLILFFLPDADAGSDTYADYVKNLSLGRGLPSHIVYASAVDDPEAMPGLIVQMLARTGNTPAALADPLEGFDAVVGVDLVQRQLGDIRQIVAIARVYTNNGTFVNYSVRSVDVAGDQPPYLLMRGLFNQKMYANRRVVLHVNGRLPDDVKKALAVWGQAIKAKFALVEIVRRGAPRIYAFDEGKVTAPPVGSAFYPDEKQAFLVLTAADDEISPSRTPQQPSGQPTSGAKVPLYLGQTPQPVHLLADGIPVRQALDSVRRWALLDYSPQPRGIPATITNTDALAYWLSKGGTFAHEDGDVPFWL